MAVDRDFLWVGPVDLVKVGDEDIGGTYDGVSISAEQEGMETEVDQVKSPVKHFLTKRKMLVVLNMAELSLANLRVALNQPAINLAAGDYLYIDDSEMAETTLELQLPTPDETKTRIYWFTKVRITGSGEHKYEKAGQTFVTVELSCYPDTDNSNRIAYIYGDNTA